MRRAINGVALAAVALVGFGAAAISTQERAEPSVSEERLTSEVFGDPLISRCVAAELESSGQSLERLAALLGDESAGELSDAEQERLTAIITRCVVDASVTGADGSPMTLDSREPASSPVSEPASARAVAEPGGALPEQPVVEVRIDPELPLAANNLD